jgi:hypothetical protein
MGSQGAARLIDMAESRPYTPAAAVFPDGPALAQMGHDRPKEWRQECHLFFSMY